MSELVIDLTQDGGDGSSNSPVVTSTQLETTENGEESGILAKEQNCGSSDPATLQGSPIMTQASSASFRLHTNVGKIFYAPAETDNRAKRTRAEPLWYVPRHAYPPEIEYKLAPSQLGPVAKKAKINQLQLGPVQKVLEKSATLENQVKELTFKYNELVDSNTFLRHRPSSSSSSVENPLWMQPYQNIPEGVWDELQASQM